MVFHGLWLPRSFKVASWFFAGFHRFQDSFTLLHGFFVFGCFLFFVKLPLWLFIIMVCSMIFQGIFMVMFCSVIVQGSFVVLHGFWPTQNNDKVPRSHPRPCQLYFKLINSERLESHNSGDIVILNREPVGNPQTCHKGCQILIAKIHHSTLLYMTQVKEMVYLVTCFCWAWPSFYLVCPSNTLLRFFPQVI